MATIGSRIYGLKQLDTKLRKMAPAAMRAARLAVVEAAQEVANLQQNLVPYDEGELYDSIIVTPPNGTTPPYSQPGGQRRAGPEEAIITAGNNKVRYAHLVEYGAKAHVAGGLFEGALIPDVKAQPFFWPAWRAMRGRAKGKISRKITTAIKRIASGKSSGQ